MYYMPLHAGQDANDHTPGTCRYVPVRTKLYRPVLCYRMYRYILLGKCRMTVQVGTYILVRTSTGKYPKVRMRMYLTAYKEVQGSTERSGQYTKWYKAVQVKVQQGTRHYMVVHVSTRSAFQVAPGRWRGGRGGG